MTPRWGMFSVQQVRITLAGTDWEEGGGEGDNICEDAVGSAGTHHDSCSRQEEDSDATWGGMSSVQLVCITAAGTDWEEERGMPRLGK